jgi:predicted GNAT family N-acyltransferase
MSNTAASSIQAAPVVRRVTSCQDLHAVAKLRYAVYAEEESLDLEAMNHDERTLVDTGDAASCILAAFDGETAVATIRIMPLTAFSPDDQLLSVHPHALFPCSMRQQCSIGRLMVLKPYRGGSLCAQILAACYTAAAALGYEVGYLETNPRTLPLYESVGCRCTGSAYGDDAYGLLVPMAILFRDTRHLVRINSPLYWAGADVPHNERLAHWFEARFGTAATLRSVARFDEAQRASLASLLKGACGSLASTTDKEIARVLRATAMIDVDAGTCILRRGSRATEAYLILDGCVAIDPPAAAEGQTSYLSAGSMLQECNLLGSAGRPVTHAATAATPTRLLSLNAESIAKLRALRSAAARFCARVPRQPFETTVVES